MQKNQEAIELTRYQREVEELKGEVQQMRQEAINAAHERDFYALLGQGYHLNVEKEVKKTAHLVGNAYEEYLSDLKENYRRTAGHRGDDMVQTASAGVYGAAARQQAAPEEFGDADLEVAERYMREQRAVKGKDPSWEECRDYAMKHRNGSH